MLIEVAVVLCRTRTKAKTEQGEHDCFIEAPPHPRNLINGVRFIGWWQEREGRLEHSGLGK